MSKINPDPFTTRPEIEGTFGVVTSTHWIATAVGMATLEKGGNAFDAGVATAFTLQVVEPHLNGPGGDVPIIVHDTKRGRTEVICGQGPAPAGATIAHYRSEGLEMVPGTGLLAACVPGTFESWMLLLRDYGTLRLRDVLEPAIAYARDGYPLVERASATIATVEQLFRKYWTTSAAVYLPNNEVPKPGTLFTNKRLAETYARILKEAESAGSDPVAQIERARKAGAPRVVAEAIDRFCRTQEIMDVSGSPHRGVLSADDMARWQPSVEAPLTYDYGRYTVCKPGVWSQGPVMLQQLALLKGFELDGLDPAGPEFIHLQVECAKLAFADREKFYGDPNFSEIPVPTLLSDAYNDARRKLISEKASLDFVPGSVEGFGSVVKLRRQEGHREAVGAMGAGEPTVGRFGEVRGDTVHFDIIDQAGNMISATPSGGWLQSSPVIPDVGFCLGSRAQMFWLEENHTASLQPGKRPRTPLSPTIGIGEGEPYMAWGSPGGDQQDQWITQFFLRHVHAKMNLQEAIDAPAWHSEHFPISLCPRHARPGGLGATADELKRRGHIIETGPDWSEGRLTAASKVGRRRRAGANPRGMQGSAAGLCRAEMAWSIIARGPARGQFGIAVATRFLAVGARVPHIAAGFGGIATQALTNPYYGIDGLKLLREGRTPRDVVDSLTAADPGRDSRQLHVMDAGGHIAGHTGSECVDWCGHIEGVGFSIAGNMLTGARVLDETARTDTATEHLPFARRLIAAMRAGEAAGGDKRGRQSAALLIYGDEEWSDLDLRGADT